VLVRYGERAVAVPPTPAARVETEDTAPPAL
jgi:hypothetical protein